MGLGITYELVFLLSGLFSLSAVLLGGELPLGFWSLLFIPYLSLRWKRKQKSLPALLGTLLALFALLYGVLEIYQKGIQSIILSFSMVFVLLLAVRLCMREKPEHDLQSLLLGLFLLFAGTVLHTQISYAPIFLGYTVSTVWALIAWQLLYGSSDGSEAPSKVVKRRSLRTDVVSAGFLTATTGVSLLLLLFTVTFFALFPRIGVGQLSFLKRGSERLPDSVNLSQNYRIASLDADTVARIKGIPFNLFDKGLYFRAEVYDELTGSGFRKTDEVPQATVPDQVWSISPIQKDYEVFLTPVTQDRLLTLGPAKQAYIQSGGGTNPSSIDMRVQGVGPSGELIPTAELRGPIRYHVTGTLMLPFPVLVNQLDDLVLRRSERYKVLEYFVRVPSNLNPAIENLTAKLSLPEDKPWEIAGKIRKHLYENYTYAVGASRKEGREPIYSFLFDERSGHCEYFAATFALMLRLSGVPARVVGGYQGGYWDDSDEVIVFTGKNAHVWVEWYHPRWGWVIDDATPVIYSSAERLEGAVAVWERLRRYWDDYVVEYNLDTQAEFVGRLLKGVSGEESLLGRLTLQTQKETGFALVLSLLFLVGIFWTAWRWTRKRQENIVARLERIFKFFLPQGLSSSVTFFEALDMIEAQSQETADPALLQELKAILAVYHEQRFAFHKQDVEWNTLERRVKRLSKRLKGHTA